jgi:hypothetical protein
MLNCFFWLSVHLTENAETMVTMASKGVTHIKGLNLTKALTHMWFYVREIIPVNLQDFSYSQYIQKDQIYNPTLMAKG